MRMRGVVTKTFHNKGFLFVRGEDNVLRFAHCREFQPPVAFDLSKEGSTVEFEPYTHPERGERATKVTKVA